MSLSYWRLLNTRPSIRAKSLTNYLMANGVAVEAMPLLELVPSALSRTEKEALQHLESYDVVVCVSPMAAELGLAYSQKSSLHLLNQTQWVAVGNATADVLRIQGIEPLLPKQSNNEGMLNMPVIQHLSSASRVQIWRGEGGRRLLYDDLLARGVCVDSVSFYARQRPKNTKLHFQECKSWANVVLISSGEAWQHWVALCAGYHVNVRQYHYLVLGERIYNRVCQYLSQDVEPEQSSASLSRTFYNVSSENVLDQILCLENLKVETVLAALKQLAG